MLHSPFNVNNSSRFKSAFHIFSCLSQRDQVEPNIAILLFSLTCVFDAFWLSSFAGSLISFHCYQPCLFPPRPFPRFITRFCLWPIYFIRTICVTRGLRLSAWACCGGYPHRGNKSCLDQSIPISSVVCVRASLSPPVPMLCCLRDCYFSLFWYGRNVLEIWHCHSISVALLISLLYNLIRIKLYL